MSSDDALQHLPIERWEELQNAFKIDWPLGLTAYYTLKTQKELLNRGLGYGFKVYCPYGDVTNGMVAINTKSKLNEVIIQCPKNRTVELENSLTNTKIIDWNNKVMVPFMPNHVLICVHKAAKILNLEIDAEDTVPNEMFVLNKERAALATIGLPESITFGLLSKKHVDIVDSAWRNRFDGSKWYFDLLIKAKLGFGLFLNEELISWVFINEVGALTHLFTLEDYRKKGYAEALLTIVCNIRLQEHKDTFAYCRQGNINACKLYIKLGFEKFHEDTLNEIIILCPKKDTSQLENALLATKAINWNRDILVPFLPAHIYECVEKVAAKLNMVTEDDKEHHIYDCLVFDKDKPAFEDISLPQDITFGPILEEHIDMVDDAWPNQYDGSKWFFRLMIRAKSGFGLFKHQELVSCVFINEIGSLAHLYTFEGHKRKGYSKMLMKLVCNRQLNEKKITFCHCKRGNPALHLYESLGFDKYHTVQWFFMQPGRNPN